MASTTTKSYPSASPCQITNDDQVQISKANSNNICTVQAPWAFQDKCCKIPELDLYYFSAEIESHLAFQTISKLDKPTNHILNYGKRKILGINIEDTLF